MVQEVEEVLGDEEDSEEVEVEVVEEASKKNQTKPSGERMSMLGIYLHPWSVKEQCLETNERSERSVWRFVCSIEGRFHAWHGSNMALWIKSGQS